MNLDFFFEDAEHNIPKNRFSDYKLQQAIQDIVDTSKTLSEAAQEVFTTRMWQWYDVYKQWLINGSQGVMFEQPTLEEATDELTSHFRQVFKAVRTDLVKKSTVNVGGNVFDADEDSQHRLMAAMLSANDDIETTIWVLADNTVINLNRVQIQQVLRACTLQMASIWIPE